MNTEHKMENKEDLVSRLISVAEKMQNILRDEQDTHDVLGTYSLTLHEKFLEYGFYRLLQPRCYGGFELDLKDYYRIMIAISRGHPAIGWNLTLGAGHSLLIASHCPEPIQRNLFCQERYFAAPHRAFPSGNCRKVSNGFVVNGIFRYCTGITYSTHLIVNVLYTDTYSGEQKSINCIIEREQYEILDDWGGDRTLGMRASGSNSVRVTNVFVPDNMTVPFTGFYANQDVSQGTHGYRLHHNPIYLGYMMMPYHAHLVAPIIGAAKAAIDEYKSILLSRSVAFSSSVSRADDSNYQRAFGQAQTLTEAAEFILLQVCEQHKAFGKRWEQTLTPISVAENIKAWGTLQQSGRLACDAVELLFRTAGSVDARKESRLLRYFADVQMYRGHIGSQWENFATYVARAELGKPLGFLEL